MLTREQELALKRGEVLRNPHASEVTAAYTVRLDEATVAFFKNYAAELDIPWESMLSAYLRSCAHFELKIPQELPTRIVDSL
ncbi:hypothetical protein ACLB1G_15365 [Oxalobacteraceae bacterium A2-2]